MVRDKGHQFFVVPPFMDPAQSQFLGDPAELRRIIHDEQLNDGPLALRVIGDHRQRIEHVFPLLWSQARQLLIQ